MLLGLVERFLDPLDGLVLLDDTDLSTFEPGWLHGQMGYVSQEPGASLKTGFLGINCLLVSRVVRC